LVKYKLDAPAGLLPYHQSDTQSHQHTHEYIQKTFSPPVVCICSSAHTWRQTPAVVLYRGKRCKIVGSYVFQQI